MLDRVTHRAARSCFAKGAASGAMDNPKLARHHLKINGFCPNKRDHLWVHLEIHPDQTERSSIDFFAKTRAACPIKIIKLLPDDDRKLTDRPTSKKKNSEGLRIPSGKHVFDFLCRQFDIEHRLIPPRHPLTSGIVERFNGRISEIVNQTRFGSTAKLESTLRNHLKIYNHTIPQRALKHQTPVQALKKWRQEQPE